MQLPTMETTLKTTSNFYIILKDTNRRASCTGILVTHLSQSLSANRFQIIVHFCLDGRGWRELHRYFVNYKNPNELFFENLRSNWQKKCDGRLINCDESYSSIYVFREIMKGGAYISSPPDRPRRPLVKPVQARAQPDRQSLFESYFEVSSWIIPEHFTLTTQFSHDKKDSFDKNTMPQTV